MARPLRLEEPGGWYHVTSRGVERRKIFVADRDRRHWLELMGEAVENFGLIVHAFVLMDNHVHSIIELQEGNLAQAMQWLNGSYGMWFNRRHQRVGPLVQGRYKAVRVDPMEWGLSLSRYVHLNPVRAKALGLDKAARKADRLGARGKPDEQVIKKRLQKLRGYRWSSYGAYVGLEAGPDWLHTEVVLGLLGRGKPKEQRRAYAKYVEDTVREGMVQSPWEQVVGQVVLGSTEFVDKIHSSLKSRKSKERARGILQKRSLKAVIGAVEKIKGEKWAAFRDRYGDWGRDLVLYLGRKVCGMRIAALGRSTGAMDTGAASLAVKRFEKRITEDAKLARLVRQARQLLNVEV